jgi:hypothetical protein
MVVVLLSEVKFPMHQMTPPCFLSNIIVLSTTLQDCLFWTKATLLGMDASLRQTLCHSIGPLPLLPTSSDLATNLFLLLDMVLAPVNQYETYAKRGTNSLYFFDKF